MKRYVIKCLNPKYPACNDERSIEGKPPFSCPACNGRTKILYTFGDLRNSQGNWGDENG